MTSGKRANTLPHGIGPKRGLNLSYRPLDRTKSISATRSSFFVKSKKIENRSHFWAGSPREPPRNTREPPDRQCHLDGFFFFNSEAQFLVRNSLIRSTTCTGAALAKNESSNVWTRDTGLREGSLLAPNALGKVPRHAVQHPPAAAALGRRRRGVWQACLGASQAVFRPF